MKMTPAILTDAFSVLQQEVDAVKFSPAIEAVHIDIIDGSYIDNTTVTPLDLTVGDYQPTKLDFHFMTEEPLDFVYECEAVKDYLPIRRIYGQIERMSHQEDFLWAIKANNWQAGLALDLFTPIEEIEPAVWSNLEHILLMSVEAGAQHQVLHDQILDKIRQVRQLAHGTKLHVAVDGGIKLENAENLLVAGAHELVVGSAIWDSPDPMRTVEQFTQLR